MIVLQCDSSRIHDSMRAKEFREIREVSIRICEFFVCEGLSTLVTNWKNWTSRVRISTVFGIRHDNWRRRGERNRIKTN